MLYLHGLGHFHPENIITNRFIEDLDIGSTEAWILERVGIRTRRTTLSLDYIKETKNRDPRAAREASLYTDAQTAAAAARMALNRAGLKTGDIGLVISGSSAPEHVTPAEASVVAAELGINAPCFDLNSACSTFGLQMQMLLNMRPETLPAYILVVTPENVTHAVDYSDRRFAPLFGDGTSAAVLSASIPSTRVFIEGLFNTNPLGWDKVCVPRTGHVEMDGNAVQGFAIRQTTASLRELQNKYTVTENLLKFVGHQANLGMLKTVCERCAIAEENHWFNVDEFGNTGGAGAPCVLSQHWDEFQGGLHIALVVVGGGLSWVQLMLRLE